MKCCFLMAALALLGAAPAMAAPMVLTLSAGDMLAQTHSHALVMTVTGTFRTLTGTLDYDPAAKTCHIDVIFVVESLTSPNALMRAQTMSKAFLDPVDYPTQHYAGDCEGTALVGNLTMRGQTHPFNMAITYETHAGLLTAIHTEGVLNRHDWGLNGLNLMVGKMIRVSNDIALNGLPPVPAS